MYNLDWLLRMDSWNYLVKNKLLEMYSWDHLAKNGLSKIGTWIGQSKILRYGSELQTLSLKDLGGLVSLGTLRRFVSLIF